MPGQFTLSLMQHRDRSLEAADQIIRKTFFGIASLIVLNTPVDTGRLRANWQYGMDAIPVIVTEKTDKDGTQTLTRLTAELLPGEAIGHIHYLGNSLPYAMRIEYGFVGEDSLGRTYNQAPQAMVGRAFLKAEEVARQAAASVT